jgi:hypothetical protein
LTIFLIFARALSRTLPDEVQPDKAKQVAEEKRIAMKD